MLTLAALGKNKIFIIRAMKKKMISFKHYAENGRTKAPMPS